MGAANDDFAAQVADRRRHVVADFSGESAVLLVLFGGIAGGVSMPVYEFFRVSEGYPVKRLFLRDPRRAWYLRGLPGIGDDGTALVAALRTSVRESGCSRLVLAGASAGGFAAISLGARLGADHMLAFSPQTFLGATARAAAGDDRWADQIVDLHAALGADGLELDLIDDVRAARGARIDIHVSAGDRLDLLHARRLQGLPGVRLIEHGGGGHRLVKWLRDNGRLGPILTSALESPGSASKRSAES